MIKSMVSKRNLTEMYGKDLVVDFTNHSFYFSDRLKKVLSGNYPIHIYNKYISDITLYIAVNAIGADITPDKEVLLINSPFSDCHTINDFYPFANHPESVLDNPNIDKMDYFHAIKTEKLNLDDTNRYEAFTLPSNFEELLKAE